MSLLYTNLTTILKRYGLDAKRLRELFRSPLTLSGNMALWDENDPRLELASFSGTVPTFIVNQDQLILDWNPAFDLIFAKSCPITKNMPIAQWYNHLENFRRVENRTEAFFGEGILPIADRHRVVYISPDYGRMVFTKIMSPLVDRQTGRILGWSISLNINSVNQRQKFFEEFFATIKKKSEDLRFASSYDGIFANSNTYQNLIQTHASVHHDAQRFLELNARTAELAFEVSNASNHVSCTHNINDFLRCIKLKSNKMRSKLKIIDRSINDLSGIPHEKYDGVALVHGLYEEDRLEEIIAHIEKALRRGGVFTYSQLLYSGHNTQVVHDYLETVKQELVQKGLFDNLKYQFNHVKDIFLRKEKSRVDPKIVLELMKKHGFKIEKSYRLNRHFIFISGRK